MGQNGGSGRIEDGPCKRCDAGASAMWRVQGSYLAAQETHPSGRCPEKDDPNQEWWE